MSPSANNPAGAPALRTFPTQPAYQEALEYPSTCFADPNLQAAHVGNRTPFGMPLPITGQFTNVYKMVANSDEAFAVRLFLRDDPSRAHHYQTLIAYFAASPPPASLVPIDFQEQGFLWQSKTYPLVKMPYLPGILLNAHVEKNLYNTQTLTRLASQWQSIMGELAAYHFTHGDLQHGNILVDEATGDISLVDYDASYVPALAGVINREAGHPSYQHPKRGPEDYGPLLDNFSALVIYTALRLVASTPELWYRLDNGDNLLFQREDFLAPSESRAFGLIAETLRSRPELRRLVNELKAACATAPTRCPFLSAL